MKKVMESPEVQAQMEQIRLQDQKLEKQYYAAINKILYPKQRANLKKLVGEPFDRSALGWGGPWGGGPPRGPGGNQATNKAAPAGKPAAAKAGADDEADEAAPSAAPSTKAPARKPAPKSKRKSLRELRGSSSESDQ
jgi:hypothetical protein